MMLQPPDNSFPTCPNKSFHILKAFGPRKSIITTIAKIDFPRIREGWVAAWSVFGWSKQILTYFESICPPSLT